MDTAGNLGSTSETRKGSIPVSTMVEDTFTAEMNSNPATAEAGGGGAGGKTGKSNDERKTQGSKGGKKKKPNKSKAKVTKKKTPGARDDSSDSDSEAVEHTADSTSSDDSDNDADGSDSEISSDSEPEVEPVRKPKGLKKRQYSKNTQQQRKAKSAKSSSAQKTKKQRKVRTEVDTSDDSDLDNQDGADSDLDDEEDDSELHDSRSGQELSTMATISQQLQQVAQLQLKQQQQMDQLQRILTASGMGMGMGNVGLYNPLAVNTGLLNQGFLGNNSTIDGLTGNTNGRGGARGSGRDLSTRTRLRPGRRSPFDEVPEDDDEGLTDDPIFGGGRSRSNSALPPTGKNNRHNGATSSSKKTPKLEFKRVDQVWDSQIHNYKLQDTAKNNSESYYSEYLFHVRRTFDWENKYKVTVVDIKSKKLRECLQEVIGSVKGVSLVEETPKLDPNMLFLYLEDLRDHLGKLKNTKVEAKTKKERKKQQAWLHDKRSHLKVLIKYLDKDYAHVKKSLYPLLENGLITFDLLWALWKPNTLVFTTAYGSPEEHRVFKVEMAEKRYSMLKGETYYVEGKYFEYDGKHFGFGVMAEEIAEFQGSRRIDSLTCYPLQYHKNETQVRRDLIERGKKFVGLGGMLFRSHQGLAYYKKKKSVVRVEVNSRIMVDPASHRRYNPNYPISIVRPKVEDVFAGDSDEEEEDKDEDSEDHHDSGNGGSNGVLQPAISSNESGEETVTKYIKNKHGKLECHTMPKDEVEAFMANLANEQLDKVESQGPDQDEETAKKDTNGKEVNTTAAAAKVPEFSDEEYLIASPVVLGFAFGEKLWLEFTVSGIKDIVWNEHAYDSLVREPNKKEIVQALVESHKYHPTESIDDVIQGKGKGLVAVLHGPPGTGKTLTAEGISELLRCPLYNVSAGDLGTDSRYLEAELQKTLDICHAWGAILLLDEADVFLEKRNMADIHRNALVSIFLRQLEYFQGILFLTTNRVESFDEAFLSRMHIPLRYDELDPKARKAVFKMFIERVRNSEKELHGDTEVGRGKVATFTEEHFNELARYSLNGRQIKNTVITAHRVARQKGEPLGMRQIKSYLGIVTDFERDIKGGPGHESAHVYV